MQPELTAQMLTITVDNKKQRNSIDRRLSRPRIAKTPKKQTISRSFRLIFNLFYRRLKPVNTKQRDF